MFALLTLKNKNMKTKLTIGCFLLLSVMSAQISGNHVTGNEVYNSYNKNSSSPRNTITINDNHLVVNVKILLNNKADSFTIMLGTNEEAETVLECNTNLNKRINAFTNDLNSLKIKKENIYVDFISQMKIYDYSLENNKAEQFQKGFEIKKNIIISSTNINDIERIISLASKHEIYDIIKVDYANDDVLKIRNDLFTEALAIAELKKETYTKAFRKRIIGTPNATENFGIHFPKTQYKKYQAYENSEIETLYRNHNQNFIKKLARKNTTYYYEGQDTSDFDKVINAAKSEIGIQYELSITITYKIDTSL